MELKTRLIIAPLLIFIIYNALQLLLFGKLDLIIGAGASIAAFLYLWHANKKAGKI